MSLQMARRCAASWSLNAAGMTPAQRRLPQCLRSLLQAVQDGLLHYLACRVHA